jgi:hypothetical protein
MLKAGSWGRKKRPQDELPSGGPFKPAFGLSGAVPRLDGVPAMDLDRHGRIGTSGTRALPGFARGSKLAAVLS